MHLAAIVGPIPDEALMTRVNVDGTRRVLEAAGRGRRQRWCGSRARRCTARGRTTRCRSPRTRVLRPNPGYLPAILDAECERVLAEWANGKDGRVATRLRIAPVVGAGSSSVLAEAATGHPPVILRRTRRAGAGRARRRRRERARCVAVEQSLAGVYNVAVRRVAHVRRCRRVAPAPASARHPVRSGRARAAGDVGAAGSATPRPRSFPTSCIRGWSPTTACATRAGRRVTRTRKRSCSRHPRRRAASCRGSRPPPRSSWARSARRGGSTRRRVAVVVRDVRQLRAKPGWPDATRPIRE